MKANIDLDIDSNSNLDDYLDDSPVEIDSRLRKLFFDKGEYFLFDPTVYEARKLKLAINGEIPVYSLLLSIFPEEHGYFIWHNDFHNYTRSIEKGTDFKLYRYGKLIAVFEVKNWRLLFNHKYSEEDAEKQVLKRLEDVPKGVLKFLIISFEKQLTRPAIDLIKSNGITIISMGRLLSKRLLSSKIFNKLSDKLKQIITPLLSKPKPAVKFVVTSLDQLVTLEDKQLQSTYVHYGHATNSKSDTLTNNQTNDGLRLNSEFDKTKDKIINRYIFYLRDKWFKERGYLTPEFNDLVDRELESDGILAKALITCLKNSPTR